MGIIERIKEIEAEMARTQKNKATGKLFFLTLLLNSNYLIYHPFGIIIPSDHCESQSIFSCPSNCNRIPSRSIEGKDCKIEDSIAGASKGTSILCFQVLPFSFNLVQHLN